MKTISQSSVKINQIVKIINLWREADRKLNIKSEGTSMFPLLRAGDTVSLNLNSIHNIQIGDVVAFFQNQNTNNTQDSILIVHRIIKKKKINNTWWYCQKGDNTPGWGWISEENLVGKAELIQHKDKTIHMTVGIRALTNKLIGITGWCMVTAVEKLHPIIVKLGYRPSRDFPGIRPGVVKIVNTIIQKIST